MTDQKMLRSFTLLSLFLFLVSPVGVSGSQKDRAIISDDFNKLRPSARVRTKSRKRSSRTYRPVATTPGEPIGFPNAETLPVGLTIWKLSRREGPYGAGQNNRWEARRVEADAKFREGDLLRLSIESPLGGYLYVINRDLFPDGTPGETNLIFPKLGENNLLEAGRVIDIPAANQLPFKASPKPDQAGEHLVIIVTSRPLSLPSYDKSLPIPNAQLMQWEERWRCFPRHFELNGGAGQARTIAEQKAASPKGRQLTRDDPSPQTIFYLTPKNNDGLLFDVMLSYAR